MAKTIRGINVKIGANTTGLGEALKDVNKKSRDIRSELRKVDRLLRWNPESTELLAQKQKLLADRVENTREKLNRLKKAQKQVNEQFENNEISEQQYRDFQRELIKTESKLERFEEQLEDTGDEAESFSSKIKNMSDETKEEMSEIGQNMTMFSTAVSAAMVLATNEVAKYAKEVERSSKATGAGVEEYQELRYAFGKLGLKADETNEILVESNRIIGEASNGDNVMQENLSAIGVELSEISSMNSDQALMEIVNGLSQMGSQSRKTAIAGKLFGEDLARKLMPVLEDGVSNIEEFRRKAQELGVVMGEEAINDAAQYAESVEDLKASFGGLTRNIGQELIPMMQTTVDNVTDLMSWFNNLPGPVKETAAQVATLTTAFIGVEGILLSLPAAIGGVSAVLGTLELSFTPFLATGAIVVGLGAIISKLMQMKREAEAAKRKIADIHDVQEAEETINSLEKKLEELKDPGNDTRGSILGSAAEAVNQEEIKEVEEKLKEAKERKKKLLKEQEAEEAERNRQQKEQAILAKQREMKAKVELEKITTQKYKKFLKKQVKNEKWSANAKLQFRNELDRLERESLRKKKEAAQEKKEAEREYQQSIMNTVEKMGYKVKLGRMGHRKYLSYLKKQSENEKLSLRNRVRLKDKYKSVSQEYIDWLKKEINKEDTAVSRKEKLQKEIQRVMKETTRVMEEESKKRQQLLEEETNKYKTSVDERINELEKMGYIEMSMGDKTIRRGTASEEYQELIKKRQQEIQQKRAESDSSVEPEAKTDNVSTDETSQVISKKTKAKIDEINNVIKNKIFGSISKTESSVSSLKSLFKSFSNNFSNFASKNKELLSVVEGQIKTQSNRLSSIDSKLNKLDAVIRAINNIDVNIINKEYNSSESSSKDSNSNLGDKLTSRGVRGSHR